MITEDNDYLVKYYFSEQEYNYAWWIRDLFLEMFAGSTDQIDVMLVWEDACMEHICQRD